MQKVLIYGMLTLNTTSINVLTVVIKRIVKSEPHYTGRCEAVNTHLNKKLHFRIKHPEALI